MANINRSNINDIVAECISAVNSELTNQGITLNDSFDIGYFWAHMSLEAEQISDFAFSDYNRGREVA